MKACADPPRTNPGTRGGEKRVSLTRENGSRNRESTTTVVAARWTHRHGLNNSSLTTYCYAPNILEEECILEKKQIQLNYYGKTQFINWMHHGHYAEDVHLSQDLKDNKYLIAKL
jgi:hypothetical protein